MREGDAVKNRDKQHALCEDSRCEKLNIAHVARRNRADLGKYLAKNQEPKRGLDGADNQVGCIVGEFAHFKFGNDKGGAIEIGDGLKNVLLWQGEITQAAVRYVSF